MVRSSVVKETSFILRFGEGLVGAGEGFGGTGLIVGGFLVRGMGLGVFGS